MIQPKEDLELSSILEFALWPD